MSGTKRDWQHPASADWLSLAASALYGGAPVPGTDSPQNPPDLQPARAPAGGLEGFAPQPRSQAPLACALEFLAHVETDLPGPTVFGATPEGLRMTFYVTRGSWSGPSFRARYEPEGGDWLIVREDGVALPNVRATLRTSDGALLYYRATGKMDLGPDGYRQCLENRLPDAAPFAIGASISTADERYERLNRRMLLGLGTVNLKTAHVSYDVYVVGGGFAAQSGQ